MTYKEEYKDKLKDVENYLDFAIDISDRTAGGKVSVRLAKTHQLYIRLTVTCLSFIRLLPKNRYLKTNFDFWDFPSVANVTRNFIEMYHVFYYIGVENITDKEVDLRLLIFKYHLNSEKYKLYKELGAPSKDLIEFEQNLPKDREEIKNHPALKMVNPKRVKDILKGKAFLCISHKSISDRIEFNTKEFIPMYRLLSNQLHSTPFSFYSQSNERGRGIENYAEVTYIIMCIDLVTKYLLAAIVDMIKLFPDCEKTLDKRKIKIVNEQFRKIVD